MPRQWATATATANSGGAETYTRNAPYGYASDALARVCRAIYPLKTWAFITEHLRLCERSAKHRLAGSRPFTADELAALLRSEDGLAFLSALMAESEPKWWVLVKSHIRHTTFKQRQAQARRELEALIHESNRLQAGETALLLSDEEFYRPHLDPARAAHSPVGRRTRK